MSSILLRTLSSHLEIGNHCPIRVNCNVGINSETGRSYEIERLEAIKSFEVQPDTFMDLSIGHYGKPFYKEIQERFDVPIGFVPSYLLPCDSAITKSEAFDIIKSLADEGIAFVTLHLTASTELYDLAKATRKIPVTSRGGGVVLQQMRLSEGGNIWRTCLPEIIDIVKSYGIVISLGTTFRPAGITDACDVVHLKETEEQLRLCRMLQTEGVQVMVENVGHISIDRLEKHCEMLRLMDVPIMPLGPTPTDCAVGYDQIAASVGAAFMGYWGCAHIINSITRSEHQNSIFTIEETLEAIRCAKVTAHIIDVARGIQREKDYKIYQQRAKQQNCLAGTGTDCERCSMYCPLKLNN